MRLLLSALIALLLSGCIGLSREHYEAVKSLERYYQTLDARDRQLADEFEQARRVRQGDSEER